jgi:hypothetical protein
MANDPVLFKLRDPCELADFRVQFHRGEDGGSPSASLTVDDGETRLVFTNPFPLETAVALVSDSPSDVTVYDGNSAQREKQKVRIGFWNDESEYFEFWAESVTEVDRD